MVATRLSPDAYLNWYLNKNVRVLFNYTDVDLNNVEDGNVFGTRFQIAF